MQASLEKWAMRSSDDSTKCRLYWTVSNVLCAKRYVRRVLMRAHCVHCNKERPDSTGSVKTPRSTEDWECEQEPTRLRGFLCPDARMWSSALKQASLHVYSTICAQKQAPRKMEGHLHFHQKVKTVTETWDTGHRCDNSSYSANDDDVRRSKTSRMWVLSYKSGSIDKKCGLHVKNMKSTFF